MTPCAMGNKIARIQADMVCSRNFAACWKSSFSEGSIMNSMDAVFTARFYPEVPSVGKL